MRAVFGVLGLLIVLAIVGLLARKQLATMAPAAAPVTAATPAGTPLTGSPKQQVQQFEQAVQGAMQQPRPMPDEEK